MYKIEIKGQYYKYVFKVKQKKTLKIEEKHNFISKNLILIILIFSDSTIKSTTKDTYIGAIQYKVLGNNKKIW